MAREFSRDLKLLVLDQPTRGLDVGSIEFIHQQAIRKRDAGTGILLVSAELDEILELSDRIAVMYRGRIVALVDGSTANKEEIGLLMATGAEPKTTDRLIRQAENSRNICYRNNIMIAHLRSYWSLCGHSRALDPACPAGCIHSHHRFRADRSGEKDRSVSPSGRLPELARRVVR